MALLENSTIDEEFRGSQIQSVVASSHNTEDASSVLCCGLVQLACEVSIQLLQGVIRSINIPGRREARQCLSLSCNLESRFVFMQLLRRKNCQ